MPHDLRTQLGLLVDRILKRQKAERQAAEDAARKLRSEQEQQVVAQAQTQAPGGLPPTPSSETLADSKTHAVHDGSMVLGAEGSTGEKASMMDKWRKRWTGRGMTPGLPIAGPSPGAAVVDAEGKGGPIVGRRPGTPGGGRGISSQESISAYFFESPSALN